MRLDQRRPAGRRPRSHTSCDITASSGDGGTSTARSRVRGRGRRRRCAQSASAAVGVGADQEARHLLDRLLRRRQADAQQRASPHSASSRSSDSARCAPRLSPAHRVDLVDDHRARRRQHLAARLRAEQDVERLRRGDEDVRRPLARICARSACGVSPVRTQVRISTSGRPALAQLARGCRRAAPRDSSGCRSTAPSAARRRRSASRRGSSPATPCAHQLVDRGEEGGERLARAGRRGDQHVPPGLDRRPRLRLRRRRRGEAAREPVGDRRVEDGACGGWGEVHADARRFSVLEFGTRNRGAQSTGSAGGRGGRPPGASPTAGRRGPACRAWRRCLRRPRRSAGPTRWSPRSRRRAAPGAGRRPAGRRRSPACAAAAARSRSR